MDLSLRPMSTSQVLDKTFSLYRENFLLFAGIAALPPACLLVGRFLMLGSGSVMSGSPVAMLAGSAALLLAFLGIGILWLLGYALASGASVYAVSRFYLGYATTIGESYRLIKPYIGRIVGIVVLFFVGMVIVGVALGICFVVLSIFVTASSGRAAPVAVLITLAVVGIPVAVLLIYLWAIFAFSVPACVLERLGVVESMRRSAALTQGARWRLVLVYLLAFILSFVVSLMLSIPYYIGLVRTFSARSPALMRPYLMWQYLAEFISGSLAFPIVTIAVCLIYYDQRVRKEAFDLQWMMEAMGQQPPPQAAASAPPALG
jgi:hypothetical protein